MCLPDVLVVNTLTDWLWSIHLPRCAACLTIHSGSIRVDGTLTDHALTAQLNGLDSTLSLSASGGYETPEEMLFDAEAQAKRAGLNRVYVYNDKGCDCATGNKPIEVYLEGTAEEIHQVKQCAASCCGSEGILLKKYEEAEEKQ